jgi:hypothetical protein
MNMQGTKNSLHVFLFVDMARLYSHIVYNNRYHEFSFNQDLSPELIEPVDLTDESVTIMDR